MVNMALSQKWRNAAIVSLPNAIDDLRKSY